LNKIQLVFQLKVSDRSISPISTVNKMLDLKDQKIDEPPQNMLNSLKSSLKNDS
jgi:hypothetical protein